MPSGKLLKTLIKVFIISTVFIATLDVIGSFLKHRDWSFAKRYFGAIAFGMINSVIWMAAFYGYKWVFLGHKKGKNLN